MELRDKHFSIGNGKSMSIKAEVHKNGKKVIKTKNTPIFLYTCWYQNSGF